MNHRAILRPIEISEMITFASRCSISNRFNPLCIIHQKNKSVCQSNRGSSWLSHIRVDISGCIEKAIKPAGECLR